MLVIEKTGIDYDYEHEHDFYSAFRIPHSAFFLKGPTILTGIHSFPIVIALGANLGEPRAALERACALLERGGVRIAARSRLYWTRPWGVTDQPAFLNAAVAVRTGLRPLDLLRRCQQVEAEMGRRRLRHWGPRVIDLDLLLYGNATLAHPDLTLPHPLIARRDFILAPLIDLAVPPVAAVDPRGWEALLHEITPEERTIMHGEAWESLKID